MNTYTKQYIYAVMLLLFTSISLLAQNKQTLDYLILNSKDTIFGNVEYIDERKANREFHKKIRLITVEGKRKKYKRENISEFRVNNATYKSFRLDQNSQKIRLVNPKYNIVTQAGNHYFLKLISEGTLSYYELEWFEQGNTTLFSMALLKKANDSFFMRADQGLLGLKRKVLINYFSDCPKLKEKIKTKQLKKVWDVVDFYNSNCTP